MAKCNDCGQEFEHESSLEQHRQAKHSSGSGPIMKSSGSRGGKLKYGLLVLVIVAVVGGVFAFTGNNSNPTGEIVEEAPQTADIGYALSWYNSHNELHWHPELYIKINGELQTIPSNVGLGAVHQPVHTHEANNVLHWEVFPPKKPTVQNMKLGYFFQIWGKKFNSQCILDACNDGTKTIKMFVNGEPNTDFENYLVHDKDKIEIEYS